MPAIKEIRRRIKSAKNIRQVTKALQMVSAVKMRKAQAQSTSLRPYEQGLFELISAISSTSSLDHPSFRSAKTINKLTLVLIAPDKGLAGALVSNLARRTFQLVTELRQRSIELDRPQKTLVFDTNPLLEGVSVGKKAHEIITRAGLPLLADFTDKISPLDLVGSLSLFLNNQFQSGLTDLIITLYPYFKNTLNYIPTVSQYLPICRENFTSASKSDTLFEPNAVSIVDKALDLYQEITLRQFLLDTKASEHSARMVAMKNATDNSQEIIKSLTLVYNQSRQQSITNEIADIVNNTLYK